MHATRASFIALILIPLFATAARGQDCTTNATPDDCNTNGIADVCDLDSGTSADCNSNSTPDECEGPDCNSHGTPDECEPDCNTNGVPDVCELGLPVQSASGNLGPFGAGVPQSHTVPAAPVAGGDVTLAFNSRADFALSNRIDVDVNGTPVGGVFDGLLNDCPLLP
ncbi:MAG: hypothetical protein V3T70_00745 [Phycisphaerae bacterium]